MLKAARITRLAYMSISKNINSHNFFFFLQGSHTLPRAGVRKVFPEKSSQVTLFLKLSGKKVFIIFYSVIYAEK